MAPRLKPTSRKHSNEGKADFSVEHQAPVTISPEQISPANQQHKSDDFFAREQRWRTAFESSAIGITMADLDGHYLAANTVFQNMVGYTEAEPDEFSFCDITYEEDREAKLKLVRELVERNEIYRAPRSWAERNYHKLIYFHEVDKAVTSQRGNSRDCSVTRSERGSDHCAN
jgi:PAS domain S-box-containing protein